MLLDNLPHDEFAVLWKQRVGLVIGEVAVGFEIGLDQVQPQLSQQRADHRSCHSVAAIDDHPQRLDDARIDELQRGSVKLVVYVEFLYGTATGRITQAGIDLRAYVADPGIA